MPCRRLPAIHPVRIVSRGVVAAVLVLGHAAVSAQWLALCSKCVNPGIYSQTGTDTAQAVAMARITRAEIEGWCANWQPGDAGCVAQALRDHDLKKVYRASADCTAGRITAIDGNTYRLAGVWDQSDIGGGRSKWRDAKGKVVGRDNASGGLGISQQWEVLCPKGGRPAAGAAAPGAGAAAARNVATPALRAEFAVGQSVMARYGSQWVRAKVNRIRQVKGRDGLELAYDVSLDNGKRGLVPARMLRAP